jgi:acetyl esterase/lipase
MSEGILHVPARDIPPPAYLSAAAKAVLAQPAREGRAYPAPDDKAGWRALVAGMDQFLAETMAGRTAGAEAEVEEIDAGGARVYVVTPRGPLAHPRATYLDIHGGALIMGGGALCRSWAVARAQLLGVRVWAVDYRMPPDHPYPTPLDDCVAAYRALLGERAPHEIAVGGSSAGGNLAAALILRARDEGLPLPASVVLGTPELDLTESGDTFKTNLGVDSVLGLLMPVNLLYAAGHDLAHPYLSPLFGDFAKGFPPTLLSAGTRDLFLSNTVRMHRALREAGVDAELHVQEAAPHGGFFGALEDAAIEREVRRFVHTHWKGA